MEKMKAEEYLKQNVRGILQPMVSAVLLEKPKDPVIQIIFNIQFCLRQLSSGTKIAVFAVYRSENRSKKPVNRQKHKLFYKIFCIACTKQHQKFTFCQMRFFYRPRRKMQVCHCEKCKSSEKNRVYTGIADRAGRQRQTLTAGTRNTTTTKRGDASFKRSRLM